MPLVARTMKLTRMPSQAMEAQNVPTYQPYKRRGSPGLFGAVEFWRRETGQHDRETTVRKKRNGWGRSW